MSRRLFTFGRQSGAPYVVMHGKTERVQVIVFDIGDGSAPAFCVTSIAAWLPKGTAFRGRVPHRSLYYGTDATEALERAMVEFGLEVFPCEDFPKHLARYFEEEE